MPYDHEAWMTALRAENLPQGYFFTHVRFRPDDFVTDPADYQGQEAICVACTQLPDESEQKRLIRAWKAALPTLTTLRRIHFTSRFADALLEPLCQATWLEEVFIKWSGLKNIEPIQNLSHLRALHIGSSPSIANPEIIAKLTQLKCLSLENIRSVYDVSWIRELAHLEELAIEGSMWARQEILSVAPLKELPALVRLSLSGTRIKDKGALLDAAEMQTLKVFETSWKWPKGALRKLVDTRPDLWVNGQRGPGWQELEDRVMNLE